MSSNLTTVDILLKGLQESYGVTDALCACCGEAIAVIFLTPLSVIKIRMQAQRNRFLPPQKLRIHGVIDGFRKISKYEGIGALWSGCGFSMILTIPAAITFYLAYDQISYTLRSHLEKHFEAEGELHPLSLPVITAGGARLLVTWMVSPLELLKVKTMSTKISYGELRKLVRILMARQGVGVLWRGASTTLLRDCLFAGSFWFIYEYMRINYEYKYANRLSPVVFGAGVGALAGGLAGMCSYPLDLVKTYQQAELHKGLIRKAPRILLVMQAIRSIYGFRGLYGGCWAKIAKIMPQCAIVMSTVELLKMKINEAAKARELRENKGMWYWIWK